MLYPGIRHGLYVGNTDLSSILSMNFSSAVSSDLGYGVKYIKDPISIV